MSAGDEDDRTGDEVALLIPVRDEAARLPATLPGFIGSGAAEVFFLDDESADGTGVLIASAAFGSGVRVQIIPGPHGHLDGSARRGPVRSWLTPPMPRSCCSVTRT